MPTTNIYNHEFREPSYRIHKKMYYTDTEYLYS